VRFKFCPNPGVGAVPPNSSSNCWGCDRRLSGLLTESRTPLRLLQGLNSFEKRLRDASDG
jgi:hypothetical protein